MLDIPAATVARAIDVLRAGPMRADEFARRMWPERSADRTPGQQSRVGHHSTRHTFITWARRGGARADVLEVVTHNAAGRMIDQYTHWDWAPLCDAVACLDYLGNVPTTVAEAPTSDGQPEGAVVSTLRSAVTVPNPAVTGPGPASAGGAVVEAPGIATELHEPSARRRAEAKCQ
jgi:hypothetical protein